MSSRYVEAHKNTKGPGDARPTALQIVKDNGLEGKMEGKVALVTGTSSGIGIDTAKALKATGMHVFAAARNLEKAKKALGDSIEPGRLELIELDNNSLESVRKCAKEFLQRSDKLNILINNAGIMATPEGRTEDGFELQFGTNHLAHFLLFQLLRDTMLKSATPEFGSRVVNVSSTGHRYSQVQFENLNLEGIYDPRKSYGQSKLSNIYMANEIERRYGSKNLHAFSLHPGGIWTGLQIHTPKEQMDQWAANPAVQEYMKSTEQGAATTIWAALDKELEGKGGLYLEDCQVSQPVKPGYSLLDTGYESYVYDEEKEGRLWKVSNELVGVKEN
ncbi:NAD(P)-binding protein [Lindgomyces ingoldianus]|uniref:NAD(P)-binding protein n=1 Tax=Lindgomyces ingoldianus TaxID=673940 RepID=A0ACB6QVS6_9PLEO|nr:NAD(P)-binding protein [Lindgomyces ingoldianus]KAF2470678.1 NAD(P)-binding protein [Lindgomyces ingoldianus]